VPLADIYKSPAPFLVMPLQNTIHGGVLETLDCLLSTFSPHSDPASVAGPSGTSKANGHAHLVVREPKVMGLMDLPIRHCLVARKGLKIGDIKWVRSHEQVSSPTLKAFYSSSRSSVRLTFRRRWDNPPSSSPPTSPMPNESGGHPPRAPRSPSSTPTLNPIRQKKVRARRYARKL
jgi:hypothetical protein